MNRKHMSLTDDNTATGWSLEELMRASTFPKRGHTVEASSERERYSKQLVCSLGRPSSWHNSKTPRRSASWNSN